MDLRTTWPLGTILIVSCLLLSGCILPPPEGNASTHPGDQPVPTASTGQPIATPTETTSPTPWYEGDFRTHTSGPTPSPTPYVPPEPLPQVILVHYTLVNEANESRQAYPGDHCGRAYVRDDAAWILEQDYVQMANATAIMITFPQLEGAWSTIGFGAVASRLPTWLNPQVQDHNGSLPHLAWNESAQRFFVDDREVSLPYEWTFKPANDTWRMEIEVSLGPERIHTWQREQPCI